MIAISFACESINLLCGFARDSLADVSSYDLGKISEDQKSPIVTQLLHVVEQQIKEIQQLKDEIARLKEHKGKPKIPPSRLEKDPQDKKKRSPRRKSFPGQPLWDMMIISSRG